MQNSLIVGSMHGQIVNEMRCTPEWCVLIGKVKRAKIVEVPGFEPGAFRMQSECDTTTPHPQEVHTFLRNHVKGLSSLHICL